MKIACYGNTAPKELLRAAKKNSHSMLLKSSLLPDAVILTGNQKENIVQAQKALKSAIPLFYCNSERMTPASESLLTFAATGKAKFYTPYHRPLSPPYTTLTAQVDADKVGKVGFIKIHSNLSLPKGYTSGKAGSCSTLILNEMIHDIDWLHTHFGPINTVFCQGVQKPQPAIEYAMATFTLKSGVIAQVIHSYQSKVKSSLRVEICGSEGIVQFDSNQTPIQQTPRSADTTSTIDGSVNRWEQHWAAFEKVIDQGKPSKKQTGNYIAPLRISELTIQSILSGEVKKV